MIDLLWADIETTGLDPSKDKVLEVALVATDWNLDVLWTYESVIQQDFQLSAIDRRVREMHTNNGLWTEICAGKGKRYDQVGAEIRNRLWTSSTLTPKTSRDTLLAGSSVHFDRSFLCVPYGLLSGVLLSHRNLDVSTVRSMVQAWAPEKVYTQKQSHRAMPDLLDHIEELRWYRSNHFAT